jgi:putative endopeptidase
MFDNKDKQQYSEDIYTIEKMIAIIQKPIEERREHDKLYHKTSIHGFIDVMTTTCDKIFKLPDETDIQYKNTIEKLWNNFFDTANLKHATDLVVYDISFFRKITSLFQIVSLDKIKIYIQYIVMRTMLNSVTDIGDSILFKFFGKELSGKKKILSRIERSINILNNYVGEVIGKEFVSRHFDEESKTIVMDMVNKIKEEMRLSIINSTWMTNKTKAKALQKLETFKTKIGYPEKWKSYDTLSSIIKLGMDRGLPLVDIINIMRYYTYEFNVIKDIDGIKDPYKWSMNPQEVNAYFSPPRNEIVFPAGILQKPFFSKYYKPAINYGAIGVIIGHEITHGYDDQGRKYDHKGNIVNWWTEQDKNNFKHIASKMVEQYNNYKISGMNINGKLTLGENLADLGGINLSVRALYKAFPNISLKDKQDFFKSYAICWRHLMTPEKQKQQILSDPHSPAKCRIFMIRNIDEFYEVFPYDSHDRLYLCEKDRIKMW